MKRIFTLIIMLLTALTLVSCTKPNIGNKENDDIKELPNEQINCESFETISSTTYIKDDTYDYDNVDKYKDSFNVDDFAKANNLNTDTDYLVIDNYEDWLNFYSNIKEEKSDLIIEELEKFFENNVYMIFVRKASSSNLIKIVYQFDNENNKLIKSYPYENDPGDQAIFVCLDVVRVTKDIYNSVDSIKFELLTDYDLTSFYGYNSFFINNVNDFPSIITILDAETSRRLGELYQKYNEEYFETYSLGIIKFATCSSESGIKLNKIKYQDNKIITIFDINSGYVNTDDIFYLNFVFQIKKEDIKLSKDSSYGIDIKVNNTLYPEIGSSHYDKYNIDNVKTDSFKLNVVDKNNVLIGKLNETYKAGTKIIVKTNILFDAGIEVFLGNKSIGTGINVEDDNNGHWEYYFMMPAHDVNLLLRVYDGFTNWHEYVEKYLPSSDLSYGIQEEIVYNYLFNSNYNTVEDEKGYIYKYYGQYNDSFVVMMTTPNSTYYDIDSVETIDGVMFIYNNSNRIIVYNNGVFYTLQAMYDRGGLTKNDLIKIYHFQGIKFKLVYCS